MEFSLELKSKVDDARDKLKKKSREEKLQFLIKAGIVNKKGKLLKKFKASPIEQKQKKKVS